MIMRGDNFIMVESKYRICVPRLEQKFTDRKKNNNLPN